MTKKIKEMINDSVFKLESDLKFIVSDFENKTGLTIRKIIKKYPDMPDQMKIRVIID